MFPSRFRWLRTYVYLQRARYAIQRRLDSWMFDVELALRDIHQAIIRPLRWLVGLLMCTGLCTMVLEYGYPLNFPAIDLVHRLQCIAAWAFVGLFIVRLGLIPHRRDFLQAYRWQAALVLICLLTLLLLASPLSQRSLTRLLWLQNPRLILTLLTVVIQGCLLCMVGIEAIAYSQVLATCPLRPAQTLVLSFAALILLGSLFLMLPNATAQHGSITFIDALFTATSAVCVTGLAVLDTSAYYTPLGQGVILILCQLGGLGILTFAMVFGMMLRGGIGVRERLLLQDFSASKQFSEIGATIRRMVGLTLSIEALGALSLYYAWRQGLPGGGSPLWHAIFHAVSAFCNAGFSTFPNSLAGAHTAMHAVTNITVMLLIILGGIGFAAMWEGFQWLTTRGRRARLSVQSSLIWLTTFCLIVVGAAGFALLEMHGVLAGRSVGERLLGALFQSVTARTAGFNTLAMGTLTVSTVCWMILLMFIGASPGSTGGGIKTTTAAVLLLTTVSTMRGKARVEAFRRTIPWSVINQAYATFFFSIAVITTSLFILTLTESHNFLDLFFEEVSAFATVGLSRGMTPSLSVPGKVVVIISMFVGRVGSLTLAVALARQVSTTAYEYPTEAVMVG